LTQSNNKGRDYDSPDTWPGGAKSRTEKRRTKIKEKDARGSLILLQNVAHCRTKGEHYWYDYLHDFCIKLRGISNE